MTDTYMSVWDAIEDSADQALDLQLRSMLLRALQEQAKTKVTNTHLTEAKRLGIDPDRVLVLWKGDIDQFSLAELYRLAVRGRVALDVRLGPFPMNDPQFVRRMTTAIRVMGRYRDTLRALARS